MEKIQRSIHISKELDVVLRQRQKLSKRTYSAEIEFMIEKQLKREEQYDRAALDLLPKS